MHTCVAVLLSLIALAFSTSKETNLYALWPQRGVDDDLLKFVTRPDLTPPRLNTKFQSKERTAPGYIFVSPYHCLACGLEPITSYVTKQIGPHIYTSDGDLVWSGGDVFPDRKAFDFRAITIDGVYYLTLNAPQHDFWESPKAGGIVLNASYHPVASFTSKNFSMIDIHELNFVDGTSTALMSGLDFHEVTYDAANWTGSLMDALFVEYDHLKQNEYFQWRASDHIQLSESTQPPPKYPHEVWDWFHLNSIDRTDEGHYLISARFTNTIYGISSKDGSILWRLGGKHSSFKLNFQFSRQHDARFHSRNGTHTFISFFDNAADDEGFVEPTANSSSLMVVALDLARMKATLMMRIPRPDGGYTRARGNTQLLPNGNVLGGWGENAYITEHAFSNGDLQLVYEASFASARFTNYRAYKMDFIGQPLDSPRAKAIISTNYRGSLTTTIYVSWNGATEVHSWICYACVKRNGTADEAVAIGSSRRTGFETALVVTGYHETIFVQAIDVHGQSLGNSTRQTTELPLGWFHDLSSDASLTPVHVDSDSSVHIFTAFIMGVIFTVLCTRFLRQKRRPF